MRPAGADLRGLQVTTIRRLTPEIRTNQDGSLDEVFADPCQFHLEQMSATHWWMAVECGGKRVHINLHSRATIKASAETEDA